VVFGDGQGEGGGVDLQSEPVGRLDGVAVELDRLGVVATDLHRVGPEGVHPGAGLVAADQDPRCHPDPAPQGAGLEHGDVELAVVGDGVREDREPALDLAEVGHQHTLGPPGHLLAAVQPQTVGGPGPPRVPEGAPDIGERADPGFSVWLASRSMAASKPIPAAITKRPSPIAPRSMRRRRHASAISRA
jgi:hypothetical protein